MTCIDKVRRGACRDGGERFTGAELEGIVCAHPFVERSSTVYTAEYVTTETGTGCVHIAPGHGQDDYELGLVHGLDIYTPVNDSGLFTSDVPEFEGQFVFKANKGIIERLDGRRGALLFTEEIRHSYPHCWRCKGPIIFRATEQWFVEMDGKNELRKKRARRHRQQGRVDTRMGARAHLFDDRGEPRLVPLEAAHMGRADTGALRCTGCESSLLDPALIKYAR